MADYKPNSHKYKAEQKALEAKRQKVEKVVTGTAKVKKKGELSKLANTFISEDAANVKSYILGEVVVPTICKTIVDIVTDSVNMIFLGGSGRSKSRTSGSYVSYRSYSDRRDDRRPSYTTGTRFNYDEIIFATYADADAVLDQMGDIIKEYGFVTVAALFDLADLTAPYTAERYGWTSIARADIGRVRDGYVLKLPRAMMLD